jgi:hypothetical protein
MSDRMDACILQGIMMLTSGFFRLLPELPKIFWKYPVSYIVYGSWGLKVQLLMGQLNCFRNELCM